MSIHNAAVYRPAVRTDWSAPLCTELSGKASASGGVPVMFLGDSITQLWGFPAGHHHHGGREIWEKVFAPLGAENYGITGDMIQDVLYRVTLGGQLRCNPRLIVLLIGTNNLHQPPVATVPEIVGGIRHLLAEIRRRSSARILLLGIPPREGDYPIAEINRQLATLNHDFLDAGPRLLVNGKIDRSIFRDGLHLSPQGYRMLADILLPAITRMLHETDTP